MLGPRVASPGLTLAVAIISSYFWGALFSGKCIRRWSASENMGCQISGFDHQRSSNRDGDMWCNEANSTGWWLMIRVACWVICWLNDQPVGTGSVFRQSEASSCHCEQSKSGCDTKCSVLCNLGRVCHFSLESIASFQWKIPFELSYIAFFIGHLWQCIDNWGLPIFRQTHLPAPATQTCSHCYLGHCLSRNELLPQYCQLTIIEDSMDF